MEKKLWQHPALVLNHTKKIGIQVPVFSFLVSYIVYRLAGFIDRSVSVYSKKPLVIDRYQGCSWGAPAHPPWR